VKEQIIVIFENERIRVESIKSFGCASPGGFWYNQEEREIAVVTKGSAVLEFADGTKVELKENDGCVLKPHEKHRVAFTSGDCEWVCVFVKQGIGIREQGTGIGEQVTGADVRICNSVKICSETLNGK